MHREHKSNLYCNLNQNANFTKKLTSLCLLRQNFTSLGEKNTPPPHLPTIEENLKLSWRREYIATTLRISSCQEGHI